MSAPTLTSVNGGSAIDEGATGVAVVGTNFDNTLSIAITQPGSVSVAQTTTYNSATSASINLVVEPGSGNQLAFTDSTYTTNAVATTTAGGSSSPLAVTVAPVAGNIFQTLASVNATSSYRITAVTDLAAGDQLEASGNATGTAAIPTGLSLNNDATFQFASGDTPASFYVRAYDGTNKVWGAWAIQSLSAPTIISINSGNPIAEGATSVPITGTGFVPGMTINIVQGSVTVAQSSVTVADSADATFTLVMEPGTGGQLEFDSAALITTLQVTVSGLSASKAVGLIPPTGLDYENISSVNSGSTYFINAVSLSSGYQIEAAGNSAGTSAVPFGLILNSDATYGFQVGETPANFYVRAWNSGTATWGAWTLQTVSAASFAAVLTGGGPYVTADLYIITLTNGTVLKWWSGQTASFAIGGNTYLKGPPISRDKASWSAGLNVDQMSITILDDGSATINGQALVKAAWQNMLDLAQVQVNRFISDSWSNTGVGVVSWFIGTVGDIKIKGKSITITVESPLSQFKATFPRTYVLPSCANTLYDAVCQAVAATYTFAGSIGSSPTASSFPLTLSGGNKPDGSFQNGKIQFTSGVNNGQVRTVKTYIGGVVTLVYPLYQVPTAGDTVNAIFGCDKTRNTCNSRFANLAHYRGFPYVPDPSIQYSGAGSGAPESTTGSNSGGITTLLGPRGRSGGISQF